MPTPRPYQLEDVQAVIAAHQDHRCVIGRAATGLGKAFELAMLAKHYSQFGRVMILVDVVKLAHQLADTMRWAADLQVDIEMGEMRAARLTPAAVIVSTFQTQYSGAEGDERYRQFDPREFAAVLVDECETVFPTDNKSRSVVDWYLTNPAVRLFGCTATPFRTDGVAAAELFEHVAFDRDIVWGINNGWLVPARQAFVRVSLDFSSLKIREGEGGEKDYSATEIANLINNEQAFIEIAKGIIHVAGDRHSIVVCPDVATARAISHYLDAERTGCARCIFGELGDEEKDDIFQAHRNLEFQFLTSVMMLTKGYDDPSVAAVFNCRKTKSKRLYTQVLGRGTRPLKGLLDDLGDMLPEVRRQAIADSGKPNMLMVNLVGISEEVRDVTVCDVLGTARDSAVVDRAKELEAEGMESDEALAQAEIDIEAERAAAEALGEYAQEQADAADDAYEAAQRRRAEIQANVEVEYHEDLGAVAVADAPAVATKGPTPKQMALLEKQVYAEDLAKMSPEAQRALAQQIVIRMQRGLCSYKQAKLLRRNGWTKEQLAVMTRADAKNHIDAIFARGRQ